MKTLQRASISSPSRLRRHSVYLYALYRIIYEIFPPFCQVIQHCSQEWKGHINDLFDLYLTRYLVFAFCRVSSHFYAHWNIYRRREVDKPSFDILCALILCTCFFRRTRHLLCLQVCFTRRQILVMEMEDGKAPYVAYLLPIFRHSFCIPDSLLWSEGLSFYLGLA